MPRRLDRTLAGAASGVIVLVLAAGRGSGRSSAPTEGMKGATGAAPSQSASSLAPVKTPYSPAIDPANFVATVDNPLWPLVPGTAFHYRGARGTVPQTDDEFVTHRMIDLIGVKCTVVRDTVSEHGRPVERTLDFYAQDKQGNVWYMGEDSFEREHGHFAKAGDSWRSGVNGGEPGIIMPAHPQPGDFYRQEYYPPGKALDEARVLGYQGPFQVPYGSFKQALVTSEYSPLEPQTEQKYYVAGVGEISEKVVKGHREEFQLVAITHP
jgi:hypothetical protein